MFLFCCFAVLQGAADELLPKISDDESGRNHETVMQGVLQISNNGTFHMRLLGSLRLTSKKQDVIRVLLGSRGVFIPVEEQPAPNGYMKQQIMFRSPFERAKVYTGVEFLPIVAGSVRFTGIYNRMKNPLSGGVIWQALQEYDSMRIHTSLDAPKWNGVFVNLGVHRDNFGLRTVFHDWFPRVGMQLFSVNGDVDVEGLHVSTLPIGSGSLGEAGILAVRYRKKTEENYGNMPWFEDRKITAAKHMSITGSYWRYRNTGSVINQLLVEVWRLQAGRQVRRTAMGTATQMFIQGHIVPRVLQYAARYVVRERDFQAISYNSTRRFTGIRFFGTVRYRTKANQYNARWHCQWSSTYREDMKEYHATEVGASLYRTDTVITSAKVTAHSTNSIIQHVQKVSVEARLRLGSIVSVELAGFGNTLQEAKAQSEITYKSKQHQYKNAGGFSVSALLAYSWKDRGNTMLPSVQLRTAIFLWRGAELTLHYYYTQGKNTHNHSGMLRITMNF